MRCTDIKFNTNSIEFRFNVLESERFDINTDVTIFEAKKIILNDLEKSIDNIIQQKLNKLKSIENIIS